MLMCVVQTYAKSFSELVMFLFVSRFEHCYVYHCREAALFDFKICHIQACVQCANIITRYINLNYDCCNGQFVFVIKR